MHIMNNIIVNTLGTDIEKKPGPLPVYVDSSKTCTIAVPYSQGHEFLFGQNARPQCVAMSLCSLIYNKKQGISSANYLIQIMNIGNQLYSSLSQSASYFYLMQTLLPKMLNNYPLTHPPLATHKDKRDRESVWVSIMSRQIKGPAETPSREKETQTDSKEKKEDSRGEWQGRQVIKYYKYQITIKV